MGTDPGGLSAFAEAHGLQVVERPELPEHGGTLARANAEAGPAAKGKLPGGLEGTLTHFDYTTSDNDGHHYHHPLTLVVTRVPESMGFAPYLGYAGGASDIDQTGPDLGQVESVKAVEGSIGKNLAWAYKGTNPDWLGELFSPALIDWIGRSPDDFGFELADGTLVVGRNGHLTQTRELDALCSDAAYLANAIRQEVLEETATGGAERSAARKVETLDDKMIATALEKFGSDKELPAADSAVPAFRSLISRNPGTWIFKLLGSIGWLLILNVPAIAIPLLLIHGKHWGWLIAFEGGLLALIYFFRMRIHIRNQSRIYAEEAFYRAYARDRELTLEDPLSFAAAHAEADLPFKPERVLAGGRDGDLVLTGKGLTRGDSIALVAGPSGPVASAALEVPPPCIRARDLDAYAERLAGELQRARR